MMTALLDARRGPKRVRQPMPDPWRPLPPPPATLTCGSCRETLDLVHTTTIFGVPNYQHRNGNCRGERT